MTMPSVTTEIIGINRFNTPIRSAIAPVSSAMKIEGIDIIEVTSP